MKTFVNAGNRIPYSNSGSAIASGDVVVLVAGASGYVGIAVTDIAATTGTGEICIGGYPEAVHVLAKHATEAFTPGQVLYWDATNHRLTGSSTGNTRAGRSDQAYGSAATTANVILNA